jgi:hypothetical protein
MYFEGSFSEKQPTVTTPNDGSDSSNSSSDRPLRSADLRQGSKIVDVAGKKKTKREKKGKK